MRMCVCVCVSVCVFLQHMMSASVLLVREGSRREAGIGMPNALYVTWVYESTLVYYVII